MVSPKEILIAVCLTALCSVRFAAADELSDLSIKADDYYQRSDVISAIPLYEQLIQKDPKSAFFAERLAFCLMVQYKQLPEGQQRDLVRQRSLKEAERAQSLGDTSSLLRVVQDAARSDSNPPIEESLRAAEAAFTRGDLDTALAKYQELAAADVHSYEARLFAGDVYYRRRDLKLAGEWFQKAIDVDPNRETAYRYWADALSVAGDAEGALSKLIDAVVAEPYEWKTWDGLQQWAKHNQATVAKPKVPSPKSPVVSPGKNVQIAIDLDPSTGADWLVYSLTRATWQQETFAKRFPQEKKYRHSLVEEVEALQAVLVFRAEKERTEKGPDPFADLVRLGQDGMIEPYVLLSAPDEGIARDYVGYRETNREKLRTYLRQYVVVR
jgi:tetratricopeptide (TPR) repeat protein